MSNLADTKTRERPGRGVPARRRHRPVRRCPRRRAPRPERPGAWLLGGRLAPAEARQAGARGRRLHRPALPRRLRRRAARLEDPRPRAERALPRLGRARREPAPRRALDVGRAAPGGRHRRRAALRPRLRLDARARRVPAPPLRRAGLARGRRRRDAALPVPRDAPRRDRRVLPRLGRHDHLPDARAHDGVPVPALRDHARGDARDAAEQGDVRLHGRGGPDADPRLRPARLVLLGARDAQRRAVDPREGVRRGGADGRARRAGGSSARTSSRTSSAR